MSTLELSISGPIGGGMFEDGVTFDGIRKQIKAAGKVSQIKAVINSPGGSVFEGFAIFAELDTHPAEVSVEVRGVAASIASVIAMAADPGKVRIHRLGRMMMHRARAGVFGTDDDALAMAAVLSDLDAGQRAAYAKHGKWDDEKLKASMTATTWLNADKAIEAGFASEIMDGADAVARLNFSPLGYDVPEDVRKIYDLKYTPAASLAGQVLDYLKTHREAPPQAAPSAGLLKLVASQLHQLRSNA